MCRVAGAVSAVNAVNRQAVLIAVMISMSTTTLLAQMAGGVAVATKVSGSRP